MHQIRFRLGLRPKSRRELTALPRPLSWILGGPTSKGRERGEKRRAQKGRKGVKERGVRRERTKGERVG